MLLENITEFSLRTKMRETKPVLGLDYPSIL